MILFGCTPTAVEDPDAGYPGAPATTEPYPGEEEPSPVSPEASQTPYPGPVDGSGQELDPGFVPPVTGEVPEQLMSDIMLDASARSGVAPQALQVIRAESVTWRDGSLGCPEPGMVYTQALVEGYWIILDADGTTYDYRASERGTFRLCQNPSKIEATLPPSLDE